MGGPKSWLCSILAAILWLGIAQAAPANSPEPQRSFASAEEAAKAFVAALRDNKKADLRAVLGPEADRMVELRRPICRSGTSSALRRPLR